MRILGIDPGIDGALFLLVDGKPSGWEVMPTIKQQVGFQKRKGRLKYDANGQKIPKYRTEVDPVKLVEVFRMFSPDHIFLEEVTARPGQGVVSMFSFGRSFGDVRTAGAWLGCGLTRVRPQEWQKVMFAGIDGSDPKKLSKEVVAKIWPSLKLLKSKRSRKPHEGACDAGCLAEYGRRHLKVSDSQVL